MLLVASELTKNGRLNCKLEQTRLHLTFEKVHYNRLQITYTIEQIIVELFQTRKETLSSILALFKN